MLIYAVLCLLVMASMVFLFSAVELSPASPPSGERKPKEDLKGQLARLKGLLAHGHIGSLCKTKINRMATRCLQMALRPVTPRDG